MEGCGGSVRLGGSPKAWFEEKMEKFPWEAVNFALDRITRSAEKNDHRVEEAQDLSIDGRAWLPTTGLFGVVTWRQGDPSPIEAEEIAGKKRSKIYALPGSTLWYALRYHSVWTPHKPKTILDRIVDALGPELVVTV